MGPTFREFNMISESYGFPIINQILNPDPEGKVIKNPNQKAEYNGAQGNKSVQLDEEVLQYFINTNVT